MKRILARPRLQAASHANYLHATSRRALSISILKDQDPKFKGENESRDKSKSNKTADSSTESYVTARKKTSAELDQELRERLEALSGDGGGAGVEYENGKATGLKRGVKSNMFRVI
ncbi:hypothetical protein FALBO_6145 [Fusarium albosuccineum]|uniref:Uncharacterized protein n=1 Tax=Fusarium albosuccineum TaxID=1237068 RepID=A0A8H4PEW4_9HYPO|nr:hypothetical protein FALBO_6145 [Fusarium albosuccineum]